MLSCHHLVLDLELEILQVVVVVLVKMVSALVVGEVEQEEVLALVVVLKVSMEVVLMFR